MGRFAKLYQCKKVRPNSSDLRFELSHTYGWSQARAFVQQISLRHVELADLKMINMGLLSLEVSS
jgi:hypothetical protein